MGNTQKIIDEIRVQIAPSDETLRAARERRDEVLGSLSGFDGRLRDFVSGSIGHRTANDDTDADGGIVLDRRTYPDLGPDGSEVGPDGIVEDVRSWVRERLKPNYPNLSTRLTKRAIVVRFDEPLTAEEDASDPSVDLIVALTRKNAEGLWIPNREQDCWDASHPEKHTELLTAPAEDIRRIRARAIRVVKAYNKQFSRPGLCAFNIEALALECLNQEMSVAEAVTVWFDYAAKELRKGLTKDPARVSGPIKLLEDRDTVVQRLESAAKHMRAALDHDEDEDAVREELAMVFWKYVEKSPSNSSKASLASILREGNATVNRMGGVAPLIPSLTTLKTPRSFGDGKVR